MGSGFRIYRTGPEELAWLNPSGSSEPGFFSSLQIGIFNRAVVLFLEPLTAAGSFALDLSNLVDMALLSVYFVC